MAYPSSPLTRKMESSGFYPSQQESCMLCHSAILPLKYIASSHNGEKAFTQSHSPHSWVHGLQKEGEGEAHDGS